MDDKGTSLAGNDSETRLSRQSLGVRRQAPRGKVAGVRQVYALSLLSLWLYCVVSYMIALIVHVPDSIACKGELTETSSLRSAAMGYR
jgi:hypothetical protein